MGQSFSKHVTCIRVSQNLGEQPSALTTLTSRPPGSFADISYNSSPHHMDVDEVYPGLYVGGRIAATDKQFLKRMGINYVLNAADGNRYAQVDTNSCYYRDCPGIHYKGLRLMNRPSTDISKFFHEAADFIDKGISSGGRVLVHCVMGLSRSATCALAFLMIKRGMTFAEALGTVRARRLIQPNERFVRQLKQLERKLCVNRNR